MHPIENDFPRRISREIGLARPRHIMPDFPHKWISVLDVHPTARRPDTLPGWMWVRLPDRIQAVSRRGFEFWYEPPGCALTDRELALLRQLSEAEESVTFQAADRSPRACHDLDALVDVLKALRRGNWILLETWPAELGRGGVSQRRYTAARAACTSGGREALDMINR